MAKVISGAPLLREAPPKGNFVRGAYSFRRYNRTAGRPGWHVYKKGQRSHWAIVHSITESTDGSCYIISGSGHAYDARVTFEDAVNLALARIAMEDARLGRVYGD